CPRSSVSGVGAAGFFSLKRTRAKAAATCGSKMQSRALARVLIQIRFHRHRLYLLQWHTFLAGNARAVFILGSGGHDLAIELRYFDFYLPIGGFDFNKLARQNGSVHSMPANPDRRGFSKNDSR